MNITIWSILQYEAYCSVSYGNSIFDGYVISSFDMSLHNIQDNIYTHNIVMHTHTHTYIYIILFFPGIKFRS